MILLFPPTQCEARFSHFKTTYCGRFRFNAKVEMTIQLSSIKPDTKEIYKVQNNATLVTHICFILENKHFFCKYVLFM